MSTPGLAWPQRTPWAAAGPRRGLPTGSGSVLDHLMRWVSNLALAGTYRQAGLPLSTSRARPATGVRQGADHLGGPA